MAQHFQHVPEDERYSEREIELLRKTMGLDWIECGDPIYQFPLAFENPEVYEILLSLHETGKMPNPMEELSYGEAVGKVQRQSDALRELQRDNVVNDYLKINPKFEENLDIIFMLDREKLKGYFQEIRVSLAESAYEIQRDMEPDPEDMFKRFTI